MYHPSRGGVRGGSDQFTWDSVKSDKHRENYLGHSVMAPVGRWQKGKDLSWYAKERNSPDSKPVEKSESLAAIKKAEEDAMLVALGLKSAEKEQKTLAREDIATALKRNATEHDSKDTERIGGIGIESGRIAMLTSGSKQKKGMMFETFYNVADRSPGKTCDQYAIGKRRSKPCKKLKREKKERHREHKHKKKKRSRASSFEMSDLDIRKRKKHKKHHSHAH